MDRRRETSRYAARDRRGKESDIFADLKEVVPVVDGQQTITHVDRIAMLRIAVSLCRLRKSTPKCKSIHHLIKIQTAAKQWTLNSFCVLIIILYHNRSIITVIKLQFYYFLVMRKQLRTNDNRLWSEEMLTECLDGFLMICDGEGLILYVTESCSLYIGLTQVNDLSRIYAYLSTNLNQNTYWFKLMNIF